MGATSSAIVLGDLSLTWSNDTGDADLSLIDSDLAVDRGLETSVLLSLFLDRRAEPDDKPPSGDDNDRRGNCSEKGAPCDLTRRLALALPDDAMHCSADQRL